jgi:hypothetical protein
MVGRDGEVLAMDVARFGAGLTRRPCSSSAAAATAWKASAARACKARCWPMRAFTAPRKAAGVAVLYVHALNPYGFSWWRRVTHENVDLNRNWQDFSAPLPVNAEYERIAHLLLPPPGRPVPKRGRLEPPMPSSMANAPCRRR